MRMNNMIRNIPCLISLAKLILVTALIVTLPFGLIQAAQEAAGTASASITNIKISFKMNPSVTRGMYMGDRWLSPPYYNVEEGKEISVEALAQGLDAQGKLIEISPTWKAGDPAMIKISLDKGQKVTLTIIKEGKSNLRVSFGDISRELLVKAWHKDNAMHVEISQ